MEPIRVECYAGYQAEQEPVAVHVDGVRRTVLGVDDRRYDPSGRYFRVRLDDGHRYLLHHDRREDRWYLVQVTGS